MIHADRLLMRALFPLLLGAFIALQGCAVTHEPPAETRLQGAMLRWNQCLERFDYNLDHYCDGHRRDVVATFPYHLENQVGIALSEQMRVKRASRLVKIDRSDASRLLKRLAETGLANTAKEAIEGDL